MTQITDLPDLCVRQILEYIPLLEILRLDHVFPDYSPLQFAIDNIKNRSNLTLLLGDKIALDNNNANRDDEDNHDNRFAARCKKHFPNAPTPGRSSLPNSNVIQIDCAQIDKKTLVLANLSRSLPAVERLELVINDVNKSMFDKTILPLIESFAERLTVFKFRAFLLLDDVDHFLPYTFGSNYQQRDRAGYRFPVIRFDPLIACINTRMRQLQCLHLHIRGEICATCPWREEMEAQMRRESFSPNRFRQYVSPGCFFRPTRFYF